MHFLLAVQNRPVQTPTKDEGYLADAALRNLTCFSPSPQHLDTPPLQAIRWPLAALAATRSL
jgi:hypothetical protein